VPSLGTSFGRGAATMSLWGLAQADCIIVMGSNMAENHPVGFRFVVQAKARGATVIHVDPRFTRTSALADIYAPIRPGTDIAFLGGMIHYILQNDLWFREWAMAYTNIAAIVSPEYHDAAESGLFSGWREDDAAYDNDTWQYDGEKVESPLSEHHDSTTETLFGARQMAKPPPEDPSLHAGDGRERHRLPARDVPASL
jgi:formate dehydrogenase major subunit